MAQQKTQVSKSGIDFFYDTTSKLRLLSDSGRLYSITGSTISDDNKLVIYSDLSSSSVNTAKYADGLGTSTAYYSYSGLVSALDSKLNKNLMPEVTASNKGYYITTDGTKYIWKDLSLSVKDLPQPFTSGYLLSNDGTNLKWSAPYSLPVATSKVLGGIKVSTGLDISNSLLSVKYGNSEGTACQGNDSRLSDAREASDVYPWAKSSSKPTYTFTDVGIPEVTNNSNKVLSNNGSSLTWKTEYSYSLPAATSSSLGGVIVSTGLSIDKSGNLSVSYGTTENTACQGNDTRLSDSRPASDVYPWAKAKDKPSYTFTDVGLPEVSSTTNSKVLSNNGTNLTWIDMVSSYELPAATSSTLGGIIVSTGLSVDANGKLSVSYGNTASTACVGNDSRLSDSRPASDVYTWAKAATKPSYTYSEVGAAADNHSHGNLTKDGKIGANADRFVITTTDGTITSSSDNLYISSNNIYSTGFYVTSSRSKKHDIKTSNINAIDIINSIDIVEFKYNNDTEDRLRIGLIAEDSPELVVTNKADAMDSGNVLGLLLKAVQELAKKVSTLYYLV